MVCRTELLLGPLEQTPTTTTTTERTTDGMAVAPQCPSRALSREVATTCDMCQLKVQAIAELLLLTSELRPVTSDALKIKGESFSQCQDIVTARTKELSVAIQGISALLHSITAKWNDICERIIAIGDLIVALIECCSHSAYLLGVQSANDDLAYARKPIIDKYCVCRASIDIDVSCARMKHSSIDELSPHSLVKICSEISRNLSLLTDCCREASEAVTEPTDAEQFKLCVKSITSNASCLLASIRSFKSKPSEALHRRSIAFGEALTVSTNALVNFAIEPEFIGDPIRVGPKTKNIQSSILGACMSTVSAFSQLCQTIRALAYDNKNPRHRGRANLCLEALINSTSNLTESMSLNNVGNKRLSPSRSVTSLSVDGTSLSGSIGSLTSTT